jgi:hypothetical protein
MMIDKSPVPVFQVGRSVSDIVAKFNGQAIVCDYKYDGMRALIHASTAASSDQQQITIFSRNCEDISAQFPDVLESVRQALASSKGISSAADFIIDAEIVAVRSRSENGQSKSQTQKSSRASCTSDVDEGGHDEAQQEPLLLPFQLLSTRHKKVLDVKSRDSLSCASKTNGVGDRSNDPSPAASKISHFFGRTRNPDEEPGKNKNQDAAGGEFGLCDVSVETAEPGQGRLGCSEPSGPTASKHNSLDVEAAPDSPKFDVCVFAFDLLMWNGRSLLESPLHERRKALQRGFGRVVCKFEFAKNVTIEVEPAVKGVTSKETGSVLGRLSPSQTTVLEYPF